MKAITMEDAVLLSGLLSCFAAAAVAVVAADASAVETAAATIAACGLSYCSSAVVDGATAIAAAAVIPSANIQIACHMAEHIPGLAYAGPGFFVRKYEMTGEIT